VKLSAEQRLTVQVVAQKHLRLVDVKLSIERQVRAELQKRLGRETSERDRAIIDAFAAGVPKVQIAAAMGSTNPKLVREVIERHKNEAIAQYAGRYAWGEGPNELVITLEGDLLDDACEATSWTPGEAIDAGVSSATFEVRRPAQGNAALRAKTASFVEQFGRLHPVVAWGRRNSAEVLAWWKEAAWVS